MPLTASPSKLQRRITSAGSRSQQFTSIAPVALQPKQDAPRPNTPVVVPSDAALVLRNLRLLDLDQLPDWPGVRVETFKSCKDVHVGQKDRTGAAEWVLYRLFEIWNPKETKSTLRPFFPSQEPLQSIKLRGALLRWLTSLKTNGVIGRECMIRKSMLDDCKGEKFEEVLLHFSTAVVKKMLQSHETKKKPASIAERLGSGRGWRDPEDSRVNPLLYAHESSLRSKRAAQIQCTERLRALEIDLYGRMLALQHEKEAMARGGSTQDRRLKAAGVNPLELKKQLRHDCTGESRWLNITISGDAEHDRDALVEDTFDKLWDNRLSTNQRTPYDPIPSTLLAELEDRVRHQQERLAQWRVFQDQLSKRNEQFIVLQSPIKTPYKSPQKSRFATVQSTPRRMASTRQPLRGNQASHRLQALQSSPTKPPADLEDDHSYLEQARGRTQPLGSPPDLQKKVSVLSQDTGSFQVEEEEQTCEDVAALDLTSPSKKYPSAGPTPVRPSRLPSPSKSPVRRPQASQSFRPDHNNAVHKQVRLDHSVDVEEDAPLEHESHGPPIQPPTPSKPEMPATANALSGEQKIPLVPTPPASSHETLSQRTQRTMADWQQKMSQAPKSYGAPSPKLHRHTRSVPEHRLKSTPDSSPERIAKLSQRTTPYKTCTDHESSAKRAAEEGKQEKTQNTDLVTDTVSEMNRPPFVRDAVASSGMSITSLAPQSDEAKPVTPPQAAAVEEMNMDDMSMFKPRNRLRRSPPNSPSPWG